MENHLHKNSKWIIYLLWVGATLINIKSIFTDFGIDSSYAIATSYRHISGDRLFIEMWEPHQTSSFLMDFLMILYKFFVPSLTGVALYLHIMGGLLWIPILIILYKELSLHIDNRTCHIICIFLFVFRPKQTVLPEFSNMQIAFSILFFIYLIKFLLNQSRYHLLVISAFFLCLEILSYPSCILAYLAAIVILFIYTKKKWKSFFCFSFTCAGFGISYLGYFLLTRGTIEFINSLNSIISADSSHTGVNFNLSSFLMFFKYQILYLIIALISAYIIYILIRKSNNYSVTFLVIYGFFLLFFEIILLFVSDYMYIFGWEYGFYIICILLPLLGLFTIKRLNQTERMIWIIGVIVSFISLIATLILTNCSLDKSLPYFMLAAAISFIPIEKAKKGIVFSFIILLLVFSHRSLVTVGYGQAVDDGRIYEIENIIRNGPAKGIVCDLLTVHIHRDSEKDFKLYTSEEDTVLIVSEPFIDPAMYMLTTADIAAHSVICTPTYNKESEKYWDKYPHKKPTVVALGCHYGTLHIDKDSYIMKWTEENYDFIGDGYYWRFYRIKN